MSTTSTGGCDDTTRPFPLRPEPFEVSWSLRRLPAGLLNLKSCELQHPDAHRLVDAARKRLGMRSYWAYPTQQTVLSALAVYYQVSSDMVLVTAGSDSAIALIVDALGRSTGRLLVAEPAFEGWRYYATLRGVEVVGCQVVRGDPPVSDLAPLVAAMRRVPTSVVALTNPSSLTGFVADMEEMTEIAAVADRNGHLLVVDECFAEIAGISHMALSGMFPGVVLVRSYSKSFALAGLRIGTLVANPVLVDYLSRFRPDGSVSGPAVDLLAELLSEVTDFQRVWAAVRTERDEFRDMVLSLLPDWAALEPGANFVTFTTGANSVVSRVVQGLAVRGVRVRSLSGVPGLDGCLRISTADRDRMTEVASLVGALGADSVRETPEEFGR